MDLKIFNEKSVSSQTELKQNTKLDDEETFNQLYKDGAKALSLHEII